MKQRFIKAINEFTELHIAVLKYIENNEYTEIKQIKEALHIENSHRDLYPVLADLCGSFAFVDRSWTLKPDTAEGVLSTKNLSPENLAGKCQHKITDLGREFIGYILDVT